MGNMSYEQDEIMMPTSKGYKDMHIATPPECIRPIQGILARSISAQNSLRAFFVVFSASVLHSGVWTAVCLLIRTFLYLSSFEVSLAMID